MRREHKLTPRVSGLTLGVQYPAGYFFFFFFAAAFFVAKSLTPLHLKSNTDLYTA
jgi:hypothetical protein